MKSKIIIMMVAGIFAAAMPGAVLAGYSWTEEYDAPHVQNMGESIGGDADMFPGSEPVETGAVPEISNDADRSLIDTHFNPFHPEREVDRSTGG